MVQFTKVAGSLAIAACYLADSTFAHPSEHHDHQAIKRQVKVRDQMASAAKRSIDSCSNSLKHREVAARSVARRAATAQELRQRRNIQGRKFIYSNCLLNKNSTDKHFDSCYEIQT